MTDITILDEIPFSIDVDALASRVHVKEENGYLDELKRLVDEGQAIARPKAMYRRAFIDHKGEDHVVVEDIRMTSRVLRVNLEHAHRVFPFVATCGMELEAWERSLDDVLHRYWAETIKEMALRQALQAMNEHMTERFRPGQTSTMNPGSLADWPIREQRNLFALLGDVEKAIGVRLEDSFLMIPTKSVSGIRFPTETRFESCQLCPRRGCPGRRALYEEGLYEARYRKPSV